MHATLALVACAALMCTSLVEGACKPFADAQWDCTTPACTHRVQAGQFQPDYQCAEYVSRSIASGGLIPLQPLAAQGAYAKYVHGGKTYDLLWVSSKQGPPLGLEDYLISVGWKNAGTATSNIHDCSVVITDGSGGPYHHVVLGVAANLLNAHNAARKGVAGSFYHINAIYNHPAWFNFTDVDASNSNTNTNNNETKINLEN